MDPYRQNNKLHSRNAPPPPHVKRYLPPPPPVNTDTDGKLSMKIICKNKPGYCLSIHADQVVLALSNPSDLHQYWIKDFSLSTRVKDQEDHLFALVNKATGQAMKHSIGATYPVRLTKYDPDKLDVSVLWTQHMDLRGGNKIVGMVNNIKLCVDASNGLVYDGSKIILRESEDHRFQRWTMFRD